MSKFSAVLSLLALVAASATSACSDSETREQSPISSASTENDSQPNPSKDGASRPTPDSPAEIGKGEDSSAEVEGCYKGDAFVCEIERIISEETSKLRQSNGKEALTHSFQHSFVSRAWSEEMASAERIGHDGFPSERTKFYTEEFGGSTRYFAENVAVLSSRSSDAKEIAEQFVTMWWNSAGHKENILGRHKTIGSGVAKSGTKYFATQLFN